MQMQRTTTGGAAIKRSLTDGDITKSLRCSNQNINGCDISDGCRDQLVTGSVQDVPFDDGEGCGINLVPEDERNFGYPLVNVLYACLPAATQRMIQ